MTELYLKQRAGVRIELFGDKEEDYSELESLGLGIQRWSGSGIHHTKIWIFDQNRFFQELGTLQLMALPQTIMFFGHITFLKKNGRRSQQR